MSPTRLCPLCEDEIATYMCFTCGHRLCRECVILEDGLCPECGGTTWIDMVGNSQPYSPAEGDEEDELEEDVVTSLRDVLGPVTDREPQV